MPQLDLLTSKELAAERRCSERKLERERAEGRGPPYVRIDARVYYRRADVEQFIAAHVCGGNRARPGIATESPRRRSRPREEMSAASRRIDELTGRSTERSPAEHAKKPKPAH